MSRERLQVSPPNIDTQTACLSQGRWVALLALTSSAIERDQDEEGGLDDGRGARTGMRTVRHL